MNTSTWLKHIANKIAPVSDSNRLEAELLLAHILKITRPSLHRHPHIELTSAQTILLNDMVQRRQKGEPIAYIIGKRSFWTLELCVNAHVLIPRPETELLVEQLLASFPKKKDCHIADLGTGCGAIALAVASERPHWTIYATDISQNALQVAFYNAQRLQLQSVHFLHSDWCTQLPHHTFDAIVSNPPYITSHEPHRQHSDLRFEPKLALIGGSDGLQAIRYITTQAQHCLIPGGMLLLEHGYQQAESVAKILKKDSYQSIKLHHDLAGLPRLTTAYKL